MLSLPSGRNMHIIVQSPKQTKNTKTRTSTFKEIEWTYFSLFSHMSTTKIPGQTSRSKTTMRCYLTLIRMAIIKKTRNNKYSKEVEKKGTLERQRIDTFELWCWRRLLRVPWTARRSNQSILKEISPGISLEGMMLKLKLQYFGHLTRRADSLEKTLMLGGIGGKRRRGRQRMRWLDGITDSMDVSLSEL